MIKTKLNIYRYF